MKITVLLLLLAQASVATSYTPHNTNQKKPHHYSKKGTPRAKLLIGADRTELYVDYLKNKNIGMVINQTSVIGEKHISSVDSLLKVGIHIAKIFGPEHGFRGDASNGTSVGNSVDTKTGIPVISLYGKHYKPTAADLQGLDLMIFDIQDVGTRFYTYLSTLHYVMEACAENHVELMILDRPNPNGFYVDGPVLDTAYRSFVGLDPIPIVHGLTLAEYAQLLNGEGWLKNHVKCKLKIIRMAGYDHNLQYKLPINPSPNLNTQQSILLYPSLCLFEGTSLSVGRGTMFPFQVVGHPSLRGSFSFSFTPVSIPGMSEDPPQKGLTCYGLDLRNYDTNQFINSRKINILWLIKLFIVFPDKAHFFNAYFTKLAGTEQLRKQIESGKSEMEIRDSWQPAL
ncbi:MAG: DUF1343 domain-containing protein, partial [Mucilaginibacter sp.]